MAIKLSRQQQQYLGAGAVFLGLFVVLYVKFFWLPISQSKAEFSDKIAQIEAKITKAEVAADLKSVRLYVDRLQEGHVHELHMDGVRSSEFQD